MQVGLWNVVPEELATYLPGSKVVDTSATSSLVVSSFIGGATFSFAIPMKNPRAAKNAVMSMVLFTIPVFRWMSIKLKSAPK